MTEPDRVTATTKLKKLRRSWKTAKSQSLHEIRSIDKVVSIPTKQGVAQYKPEYFSKGFFKLCPGALESDADLQPLCARPMLRLVSDREKVGQSVSGYLCSRLRAMELDDMFHILWRIVILFIDSAGCKEVVGILTAAINMWKGQDV